MKNRKLLSAVFAMAIIFASSYHCAEQTRHPLSDIALTNIEALANGSESTSHGKYQSMGYCWGVLTYMCVDRYTAEYCRLDCVRK